MDEKPIERLNYYNGQRLEADDLKLEQEYHIRIRRWLNKSLFSAGIAEGLGVVPEVDDKGKSTNNVIVSPGLALDAEGREIILLEETSIPVVGKVNLPGKPDGNYLFIQYREETRAEDSDGCTPRNGNSQKAQLPWGGPSRVHAAPILGWSDIYPLESSGKVVLAQVELNNDCMVRNVYTYPRQYTGDATAKTVHQYALEGERNIDEYNSGRIYFHIRGRQPNAVTLYLRAERFSTLYYSELGQHQHDLTIDQSTKTSAPDFDDLADPNTIHTSDHDHEYGTLATQTERCTSRYTDENGEYFIRGGHNHLHYAQVSTNGTLNGENGFGFRLDGREKDVQWIDNDVKGDIRGGDHTHDIKGTTATKSPDLYHYHTITVPKLGVVLAGVEYSARSGKPFTYVSNLQIHIGPLRPTGDINWEDGDDYEDDILQQIQNLQGANWANQKTLGNGGPDTDPLVKFGTGPIRLDLLSPNLSFPPGDYYIDLQVEGEGNGGRILYNLYVE
jgi:hypothetical protein